MSERKKFKLLPPGLDMPLGGMRVYSIRRAVAGPITSNDVAIIQFEFLEDQGPPERLAVSPPYTADLTILRSLRDILVHAVETIEERLSQQSKQQPKH